MYIPKILSLLKLLDALVPTFHDKFVDIRCSKIIVPLQQHCNPYNSMALIYRRRYLLSIFKVERSCLIARTRRQRKISLIS